MLTGLVIALLAVSWLVTLWALERAADAEERLAATRARPRHLPRVADRARPRQAPPPAPLERWATRPGEAVWSAGRPRAGLPPGFVRCFPDPPAPTFAPQPRLRPDGTVPLTAAVAAGWDAHEAAHRPTVELPVLVLSD